MGLSALKQVVLKRSFRDAPLPKRPDESDVFVDTWKRAWLAAPTHTGPPSVWRIRMPTIRHARRGRQDQSGRRLIPIADRSTICGWPIPIDVQPTREDAFPEQ